MFVRKFEADTLEEALQNIKKELGPDAIILKTITNKGIKGAFRKKKIEITAAISEKNYTKKASVDQVLDQGQREEFYSGSASYVANMIDRYDGGGNMGTTNKNAGAPASYGTMGLNRAVSSVKNAPKKAKNGLDDFLNVAAEPPANRDMDVDRMLAEELPTPPKAIPRAPERQNQGVVYDNVDQQRKIDELEARLYELSKDVEKMERKEPSGLYQLRSTLRSLDISENYIQILMKKAMFELSVEETQNVDLVFEFALREMLNVISTEMPMFSKIDSGAGSCITILLSETSTGQTSMIMKLAALKRDSLILRYESDRGQALGKGPALAKTMFDLDIVTCHNLAEIVSESRKAVEQGRCVFIDYKSLSGEVNETKKFVEGLRRSFTQVEILVCLSAIHSELYNKKIMSRYRPIANGLVISHIDLCMNFGALFNLNREVADMPYKFYGTGEVIPDDIESATAERVLSGIFQLK